MFLPGARELADAGDANKVHGANDPIYDVQSTHLSGPEGVRSGRRVKVSVFWFSAIFELAKAARMFHCPD